jgi:hypothetical protein
MTRILWRIPAYAALLATVVPSMLVFSGTIEIGTHKVIMAAGMILWFVTAPFFTGRKDAPQGPTQK